MKKYWQVFKISFVQEFAYRINFIMWRFRNVMQVMLIFFLWDTLFADPQRIIFGYDQKRILTYVFGIIIVKSIVLSSRTMDVSGEIARGELSNMLIRPINYYYYWFTRDISSKVINLVFAVGEAFVLYLILRPPFFVQSNFAYWILFLLSLAVAVLLYFLLMFLFSLVPFWFPDQAWGMVFILLVMVEVVAGAIFPLDVLPPNVRAIIFLTPFPHLLFTPLNLYLGKFSFAESAKALAIAIGWCLILILMNKKIWHLGLKAYRSEGR